MLEATSDFAVDLTGATSTADVVIAVRRHEEKHPDHDHKDPSGDNGDCCQLTWDEKMLNAISEGTEAKQVHHMD
jgi:hypothetical protein